MLLSTHESTQSTHKNNSNDSFKPINQLDVLLTLFGKPSISSTIFRKPSISLIFLAFFGSIELTQSCQSLKIIRLSHPLYENELTQSPNNSLGRRTESI